MGPIRRAREALKRYQRTLGSGRERPAQQGKLDLGLPRLILCPACHGLDKGQWCATCSNNGVIEEQPGE